ncbi:MAG: hypothetical protein OXC41_06580 [Gammaproteobacteria bacterium]|nr:hypothetical protein [Gammaproteobacteria bacterium]
MEKSKQYNDIIALGELLVEELQLGQSVDTLGRWMAHHVAELMQDVEKSIGLKRTEAEDRCREAILSLWKHINNFPRGHRPLADIEPLVATIKALDPDNREYFYHSEAQSFLDNSTLSEETKNWLELARELDYSARILIGMCLKKAASDIAQDKLDWFELAESLDADISLTSVVRIVAGKDQHFEGELQKNSRTKAVNTLKNQRARLEVMVDLSQMLIQDIEAEIKELED